MIDENIHILIEEQLAKILRKLKLDFSRLTVKDEKSDNKQRGGFMATIVSDDAKLLIGKYGENIQSIQDILGSILKTKFGYHIRCILDVDGYRDRKAKIFINFAKTTARKVQDTGKTIKLMPMDSYFRKLVHSYFSDNNEFLDIETRSFDRSRKRHIEISKKTKGKVGNQRKSGKPKTETKKISSEDIEKFDSEVDF